MEEVLSKETKEGPKKPQRMRYVNHVSMVPSVREGGGGERMKPHFMIKSEKKFR